MENTGPEKRRTPLWYKALFIVSTGLFAAAIGLTIYGILTGNLLGDSSFGPGAYYYTDVPNFEKIFLEPKNLGFDYPVITAIGFVVWSLFIYNVLVYFNKRL